MNYDSHAALAVALLAGLLAVMLTTGCRGPGYEYIDVEGRVTIDGQPVPKGYVTYSPAGGGPVTGGPIADGLYHVKKVPLGPHKVTFTAQAAQTQTIRDVANDATREVPIDILPSHYHSGIEVNIKSESRTLDFALETTPPPG